MPSDELNNFITRLNSLEGAYSQRIIALENKLQSYDAYFKNIQTRLDAHGSDLQYCKTQLKDLKAGVDTALAKSHDHPIQVRPKFKFW